MSIDITNLLNLSLESSSEGVPCDDDDNDNVNVNENDSSIRFERNSSSNSNNVIKGNTNHILVGIARRAKERRSQLYKQDTITNDASEDTNDYNYNTKSIHRGTTTAGATADHHQQQSGQHLLQRNDMADSIGMMNKHDSCFITGRGSLLVNPPSDYYVSGRRARNIVVKNVPPPPLPQIQRDPNISVFIYPPRRVQQSGSTSTSTVLVGSTSLPTTETEKRNMIGEKIYSFIEHRHKDLDSGRITGILLELENYYEVLNDLLDFPKALDKKIDEVLKVMENHTHAMEDDV